MLNFHGNVEGNDIFKGTTDIVVCDGFVGNVALKTAEGLASMLSSFIKQEFTRTLYARVVALVALPVLKHFKARVDHRRYNGAALLGLRGLVFKSHGSADAFAFEHALNRAYDAARNRLLDRVHDRILETLQALPPGIHRRAASSRQRRRSRMKSSTSLYSRITGTGSFLPPRRVTNRRSGQRTCGARHRNQRPVDRRAHRHSRASLRDVGRQRQRSCGRSCDASACGRRLRRLADRPDHRRNIDARHGVPVDRMHRATASSACEAAPAFDVQAVCSGFVYALTVADSMIRTGSASKALVIGAEVFSRILDFNDRTTCVLFGDGAGAVVLEASKTPGLLASELHADGRHADILCTPGTVSAARSWATRSCTWTGRRCSSLRSACSKTWRARC